MQTAIGFAITIQFHHWINGESPLGGILPIVEAGPQRQIAVPTPRVSVGVTKIRRKFDAEPAPIIPHAPRSGQAGVFHNDPIAAAACHHAAATLAELQGTDALRLRGVIGQIIGIVTHQGVTHISILVSAANIGSPSLTFNPSPNNFPNITGSDPGARGAQFIGKLIQEPHPNQQARPSSRFCVASIIESSVSESNPIVI